MFTTLFVQPVFNLLVLIYGLLPGHNFGVAIILFTVLVRMLMWPLVKKQMHHSKALRELQPELKRIKKAAAGDKQKESAMMMELYKEREINMFAPFGILAVQLPVLIGLYSGLRRIISDPHNIITFSYSFVRDLPWLKELALDIHKFDATLFHVVDLTKSARSPDGKIYWPAMVIVAGSAFTQYLQSKQLMPSDKKSRSLRQILKDAGSGKQAEKEEVTAATNSLMRYFIPVMIFFFTVSIASALSLYWLTSGLVAYLQQSYLLRKDEQALEKIADDPVDPTVSSPKKRSSKVTTTIRTEGEKTTSNNRRNAVEAEIVSEPKLKAKTTSAKKQSNRSNRKRRKG